MSNQPTEWDREYNQKKRQAIYPTEWVIRTVAGGNYPEMKLDKSLYPGKKLLDLSCGDGRNLQLFRNLGFEVHATEISTKIITPLQQNFPDVEFRVGFCHHLPYADGFFDYIVACASSYYLEPGVSFADNLKEIARILKPGGYFIGNIPDQDNSVLKDAVCNSNGECLITNDPFGLRNGYRLQTGNSPEQTSKLLTPYFDHISTGSFYDNFYGLLVSGFLFVCRNKQNS